MEALRLTIPKQDVQHSRYAVSRAIPEELEETPFAKLDRLGVLRYALPSEVLAQEGFWKELADTASTLRQEMLSSSPATSTTEQMLDYRLRSLARELRFLAPQYTALQQYLCGWQNCLQTFSIETLLNETLDMLDPTWAREDVLLRCRIADNLPMVRANRMELQQSLIALLLNAVEALGDVGGTLTFSAEAEYDSAEQVQGVCITLKDTGRGMDAETLAQAHHAHFTTKPYGAGMGATLAHDFVRSARGRLETTSELGRGTQVTLRLPALHTSSLDTTLSRFCTSAQSTSSRLLTAA